MSDKPLVERPESLEELIAAGEVEAALIFEGGMTERDQRIAAWFQERNAKVLAQLSQAEAALAEMGRQRDGAREALLLTAKAGNDVAGDKNELLSQAEAECERLRGAARRVEYAWENLRGWMPDGRGVKNWTSEMNRSVAALTQPVKTPEEKR